MNRRSRRPTRFSSPAPADSSAAGSFATCRRAASRDLRAVDIKPLDEWYQVLPGVDNRVADLRSLDACRDAVDGIAHVYNLACDMGGMGFIEANKAACMLSVLINTHLLMAAQGRGRRAVLLLLVGLRLQRRPPAGRRRDRAARGATPIRRCPRTATAGRSSSRSGCAGTSARTSASRRAWRGTTTSTGRTAPTTAGARRRPPRSAARSPQAKLAGEHEIEIWGDGEQTRSFMYIDDCLVGTTRIMESDIVEPINLGSAELVTINQLVDIVEEIAGVQLKRRYNLDAPKGVRGRNTDNTLIRRAARLGAEHAARRRDWRGRTPGSTTSWRRRPRRSARPSRSG